MNLPREGVMLRGVVFAGPVIAVVATAVDDVPPPGWLLALVVVLAVGFAALPESALGTTLLCLVVVWWTVATGGEPGHPVVIGAAISLLAAHLAAVVLSYGPAGLPLDRGVVTCWLRRGCLLAVAAPVVWILATALDGQPEPRGIWVAGLTAAIAVSVVAAAAVVLPEPAAEQAG